MYRVLKIKPTLVGQQSTGKRRLMEDTKQPEPSISFSARQCARLRLQTTNWPSCLLVVVISLRDPEPGLAPHLAAGCWRHVYVVFYLSSSLARSPVDGCDCQCREEERQSCLLLVIVSLSPHAITASSPPLRLTRHPPPHSHCYSEKRRILIWDYNL